VRLALPAAVVSPSFLSQLQALLQAHPRLRVDVRVGSPHLPGEAGIDVAVVVGTPPESLMLVGRRLGTHGWGLAASPAYLKAHGVPRVPADLSKHACLRFRSELPQRTWTLTGRRGKRVVVEVNGAFECDDSRVLGDATYAGLGIGVRPERELADAVSRKSLVHVLPGWRFGALPVHILTTAGRRGLPRIVAVTELVSAAVRASADAAPQSRHSMPKPTAGPATKSRVGPSKIAE
jgi:LysR family transcriptional activator of dmlA